jgi:hypothetical protein
LQHVVSVSFCGVACEAVQMSEQEMGAELSRIVPMPM